MKRPPPQGGPARRRPRPSASAAVSEARSLSVVSAVGSERRVPKRTDENPRETDVPRDSPRRLSIGPQARTSRSRRNSPRRWSGLVDAGELRRRRRSGRYPRPRSGSRCPASRPRRAPRQDLEGEVVGPLAEAPGVARTRRTPRWALAWTAEPDGAGAPRPWRAGARRRSPGTGARPPRPRGAPPRRPTARTRSMEMKKFWCRRWSVRTNDLGAMR